MVHELTAFGHIGASRRVCFGNFGKDGFRFQKIAPVE
jgi:hypothetical protein